MQNNDKKMLMMMSREKLEDEEGSPRTAPPRGGHANGLWWSQSAGVEESWIGLTWMIIIISLITIKSGGEVDPADADDDHHPDDWDDIDINLMAGMTSSAWWQRWWWHHPHPRNYFRLLCLVQMGIGSSCFACFLLLKSLASFGFGWKKMGY